SRSWPRASPPSLAVRHARPVCRSNWASCSARATTSAASSTFPSAANCGFAPSAPCRTTTAWACSNAISTAPASMPRPVSTCFARPKWRATWKNPMSETILVTGSSRGIARAMALRLARAGYDIVLHCRARRDAADAVQAERQGRGRRARILQFDIADRAGCRVQLEADVDADGAYYGVVGNVGLTRVAAFPALSDEDWDQ